MPRPLHPADFTNDYIDSLRPRSDGRRYEIADPGHRGLRLRVGPSSRSWLWYLQQPAGDGTTRTRVITIGPWGRPGQIGRLDVHAARSTLDQLREAHHQGRLGDAVRALHDRLGRKVELSAVPLPYTVKDLVDGWLADLEAEGVESVKELRRTMDKDVLPVIGAKPAAEVEPVDVAEVVRRVVARERRVQADKVLSYMKAAFAWGWGTGRLKANPTAPLSAKRLGTRKGRRERFLNEAEICILWERFNPAAPFKTTPVVAAAVRLLLLLPVRTGEIREAKWSDLDENEAILSVPPDRLKMRARHRKRQEEGRPWRTPVGPAAMELLKIMRGLSAGSEWICRSPYPGERGPLSERALCAAVRRVYADVPKERRWRPHDLRRTARSFIGRWAPEATAERVLGHARPGVIDVYDRGEYVPERRAALEQWERFVLSLVEAGGVPAERACTAPVERGAKPERA